MPIIRTGKIYTIFSHDATAPSESGPRHYRGFTITLRHSTLCRTPLASDRLDAETSTLLNTTLTTDRHPCPRQDSNPQSEQASGRRPRLRPRGHWNRHWQNIRSKIHAIFVRCISEMQEERALCKNIVLFSFFAKRIYKAAEFMKRNCSTLNLAGMKPCRPHCCVVGTL
jgi:hypothetical protein